MPEEQIDLHQFIKHKNGKFLDKDFFRVNISTLNGDTHEMGNILLIGAWFVNPPDSHPSLAGKTEFKLWLQYDTELIQELQIKKALKEQSIFLSQDDAIRLGELLLRNARN